MKILLIAPSTDPMSGWGTYARNTESGLRKKNHEVRVLTTKTGLCRPESLLASPLSWWKSARVIARAASEFKPDVIHVLAEPYALAMPIASWLTRLPPWLMNFHGTYSVTPHTRTLTKKLMTKAVLQCQGFLVCSDFTLNEVRSVLPDKTFEQISPKIHPIRLAVDTEFPKSSLQNHVLYVGGIKPRKGILELIEGFVRFTQKHPDDSKLHLVGTVREESHYMRSVRKRIADANLQNRVIIHGRVNDDTLCKLYGKAGAFAMLSKKDGEDFEGYGLVFIEANARGIPTISSEQSGGAEAVKDGITGYIVDHNNPEMIAQRLHLILNEKRINPHDCIEWASKHDIDQQAATCENLYESIIASR